MSPKILILFAHPALEKSRVNRRLFDSTKDIPSVTLVDLYEEYPNFQIDVDREQERLGTHDIILFQFPFFWYSTPALLKEWQDLVLEYGYAYGEGGNALKGKNFGCVISTGGAAEAYTRTGHNRFTIKEMLIPLRQTAKLCGMNFIEPFLTHSANKISEEEITERVKEYKSFLLNLNPTT